MNHRTIFLINLCALLWLSSSHHGSSLYDKFNKCAPARCGDTNVRYPFYLQGLQPSYCGEPGYNVSCIINGYFPMLNLRVKLTTYFIRFILYRDKVLPVLTQAFFTIEETCAVPETEMMNLADNPNFVPGKSSKWVVLYTGCSKPLPSNLTSYASSKCPDPILLMLEADPYSKYASRVCRRSLRMPMKVNDGELTLTGEELAARRAGANWLGYKTVLQRGIYLNWTAPSCDRCTTSGGRCGYEDGNHGLRCFCRDGAYASACPRSIRNIVISIVAGVSAAGLAVMIIVVLLRIKKKRRKNPKHITEFLRKNESLTPKRYKYSEIKKMTRSFKDKLGQGGFGTVYKGELKDGRLVAVKVLSSANSSNGEDFINEVASFSRTSHVNIVSLVGFCIEGSKRALIYQFMANGSLEKFIYEEKQSGTRRILGWDKLHSIAVGIAQGLEYLHRGCNTRILHFDIKPHNILLDENFCPKISDFGLAKVCVRQESAVSMLGARGTIGYIAPEQVCINFGQVSHKSDVYSYGMMILEMVGGRKNLDAEVGNASEMYFPQWICKRIQSEQELGLSGIIDEEARIKARKMVLVGLWCIQTDPVNRPSMSQVVEMLQGSIESLPVPPAPFMYSPSSSTQPSLATLNTPDRPPISYHSSIKSSEWSVKRKTWV